MSNESADRACRSPRRSKAYPYLVCGAVALGVVGVAAMESRTDRERAERTLRAARAQVSVVQRAANVVYEMNERIAALRAELVEYARLETDPMSGILGNVVDAMPEGVVLDSIVLTAEGDGFRVELLGVVPNEVGLARLAQDLRRSFDDPHLGARSRLDKSIPGTAFRARFSIGGAAHAVAGVDS